MKRLFTDLMMFTALAVIFSAMTGCDGNVQSSNTTANNAATNTAAPKKDVATDYPPLASGLADAEVEMLDGTKFKISDKKGKVLLINLWATWCLPCIGEMPHLRALQDEYASQGFEVIGLNIGELDGPPEPIDDVKRFVEKQKLNYTIAISPKNVTNQFQAIANKPYIPQSFIVDREGRLRGVFTGGGLPIIESMKKNVAKVMGEG